MEAQDTSPPAGGPREDDRNDELDGSPAPDPDESGDDADDPETD
jgi:hypothetical protein